MKALILFFTFFHLFNSPLPQQTPPGIKAELITIEYFAANECSEKSPILIRLFFDVKDIDVKKAKIILKFEDITYTKTIKEIDKKGNIVYSFCTSENISNEFTVTFINENGEKSNTLSIVANAKKNQIIATRPPLLINLDN